MVRYSGFIGQTGGSGGGDGHYAVIEIRYDAGDNVKVVHNGETYEAPDTSGIWLFGCEENGTYVCSLVGALIPQSVTITISEKGQIASADLSNQVIHYKCIYLYGNEYSSETGGWTLTNNSTTSLASGDFTTKNQINFSDYNGAFILSKFANNTTGYTGRNVLLRTGAELLRNTLSSTTHNKPIIGYKAITGTQALVISRLQSSSAQLGSPTTAVTKASTYYRAEMNQNISSTYYYIESRCYGVGFTQTDDISFMSSYGSTISDILANSVNLFKDKNTLTKMVKLCTGDFMIQALANSNFVSAMNASANKTILLANEHWSKFISFLSM